MSDPAEPKWLLPEAVLAFHRLSLAEFGGSAGVRDPGLLESALARPRNLFLYKPGSSLYDLAAAYAFGITRSHPFIDGNKRVSFLSALVFLEINGLELNADEAEAVVVFDGLASGHITEAELSEWLMNHSAPPV